jgi:hypothetical protein
MLIRHVAEKETPITIKRSFQAIAVSAFFLNVSIYAGPLRVGVKAGPTLSLVESTSVIYNPTNLRAAKFGIFIDFLVAPRISLQPEAYFAMKGTRYYDSGSRSEETVWLDYLEIPILLNIQILPKSLEVFIGPYFGLLVHSTANDNNHHWTWWDNRVAKNDYGLSTGMRYHVLKHFFTELQLNAGFRKAVYDPQFPDSGAHKNLTVSILVGYQR